MEQEPSPEKMFVQCEHCGDVFATDDNGTLYIFLHPAHTKYSFIHMKCNNGHDIRQFVDAEDIHHLGGHVSEVNAMQQIPKELREYLKENYRTRNKGVELADTPVEVEDWGHAMLRFLEVYQPEAWEFGRTPRKQG